MSACVCSLLLDANLRLYHKSGFIFLVTMSGAPAAKKAKTGGGEEGACLLCAPLALTREDYRKETSGLTCFVHIRAHVLRNSSTFCQEVSVLVVLYIAPRSAVCTARRCIRTAV